MAQFSSAGIDVSARTLDCAVARPDQAAQSGQFANTPTGHRQLIKWLTKGGRSVQICLEATGLYHLGLARTLHQHRRCQVMVVNPKAIKHYAQARGQRGKTDALDAHLILDYGQRLPFVAWHPPAPEILQLQAITRRMTQLKSEIIRERNRLHAEGDRVSGTDLIEHDIQVHIRHLERRIRQLEEKGRALVAATPTLDRPFQRLVSIPGIGSASALRLLAELAVLPPDMKPPQWVAHAGLDPRPYESGSSVAAPRRITKAGNKYLRAALYMPAWVAVRHQANVKAFYDKLIAAGKKPLHAIVAVMRKLLHAIWGCGNTTRISTAKNSIEGPHKSLDHQESI